MGNLFLVVFASFVFLSSPITRNAQAKQKDIKNNVPEAAEYLSSKLQKSSVTGRYSKFSDAYSDEIPEAVKKQYIQSAYWNPKSSPDTYMQCTSFVNGVFLWQYPNFPWFMGDAISYLGDAKKELGFTVYKDSETDVRPRPGDILVWPHEDTGHVAIISDVNEKVYVGLGKQNRYGLVTIYEANTEDQHDVVPFIYTSNNTVSFSARKYFPKPAGWIHWDKASYEKQRLIINLVGCPQYDKQFKNFWDKYVNDLKSKINAVFNYQCEIYIEPKAEKYKRTGLGGGGDSSPTPAKTIEGWKTYKNQELDFEFQYPPDAGEIADRTSEKYVLSSDITYLTHLLKFSYWQDKDQKVVNQPKFFVKSDLIISTYTDDSWNQYIKERDEKIERGEWGLDESGSGIHQFSLDVKELLTSQSEGYNCAKHFGGIVNNYCKIVTVNNVKAFKYVYQFPLSTFSSELTYLFYKNNTWFEFILFTSYMEELTKDASIEEQNKREEMMEDTLTGGNSDLNLKKDVELFEKIVSTVKFTN